MFMNMLNYKIIIVKNTHLPEGQSHPQKPQKHLNEQNLKKKTKQTNKQKHNDV